MTNFNPYKYNCGFFFHLEFPGIFILKSSITSNIYVGTSQNLKTTLKEIKRSLDCNNFVKDYPTNNLISDNIQSDYNRYGEDSIVVSLYYTTDCKNISLLIEEMVN